MFLFGPDDSKCRREGSPPYSRDLEGQLLKNNELVNGGGYLDGVLVDREYEEELQPKKKQHTHTMEKKQTSKQPNTQASK